MNLLVTDTVALAGEGARSLLEHAAVAIEGDRIAAVGPTDELERRYPHHERFDGRGKAVLPGFINSHTHTVLTVLRGTVEDWDGDVIYGYMSPVSYVMDDEERAVMATLGCLEAIRCGTTTLVDPFRFVPSYARAMAGTGLRLFLAENCADVNTLKIRNGEYGVDRAFGQVFLDRTIEGIERFHMAQNGRVQIQIAAHATDNCSPWMLEQLLGLAEKYRLRRTIHLSQSRQEVEQVKKAHGRLPAEYLAENGWLGPDLVAAHWSFSTPDEIELLARHGVHMAHCPANSSRRGPHRARVDLIRDAGINIAFATDNMTEDMFHAMKIGLIVHRGAYPGGGVHPTTQAIFDGVTRNGAKALARDDLGAVASGKKADLTIIDLNQPAMRPISNLVSNVVHYGHPGIVHSVMVDGAFVMRDRRMLTIDEPALLEEAQAVTERVWRRLLDKNRDLTPPDELRWIAG